MVQLESITKIFNRGRPNEFAARRGREPARRAVKVTVFKGPSGSGKTTLLSLIGCMAKPTAGRVYVDRQEITSLPERFLTDIRRRTFGFIFQQFHLIRGISALENVMLPAYPTGEPRAAIRGAPGAARSSSAWPARRTPGSSGFRAGGPAGRHRPRADQQPVRRRSPTSPRRTSIPSCPGTSWPPWRS